MQSDAGNRTGFRTDINGLRAWAVAIVVLYHFGVAGFRGGFVGVDVFFVISGFLMTGIVVKGLERGTFSFFHFYLARAKRIVPALLALCLALLVIGWFVLLPPDYKKLSTHIVYSLSFLSNIEYWQEAGYFDVSSHEKWLLHTWSLSVEWQFYIILPIVLWGAWLLKAGRKIQQATVCAGLVLSLGAAILLTGTDATASFFLLHTRAWEMLAGGLAFLSAPRQGLSPAHGKWLEAAGLALIVLSVMLFDKTTAWPGWRAMVPVAGSMMVLYANRTSLWTSNKAAQWLGDRSYSLYLWHWPVCVTLAYVELHADAVAIIGGLLATLLLGHLSYVLVENKTRDLLGSVQVRHAAALLAVVMAVVVVPGVAIWSKQGINGRFSPVVETAAAEAGNSNPRADACHTRVGTTSVSCIYGGETWKVIAVGDSHAGAIVSAIAAAPRETPGVVQWSYSGCPFVFGLKRTPQAMAGLPADYKCSEFIAWARSRFEVLPENIPVVIIGRYAVAGMGPNEDRQEGARPGVFFEQIHASATPASLQEFGDNITRSACELSKRRKVYMMRPIPEMGVDVPKTLSRRMNFGMKGEVSISLEDYRKRNAWVWAAQDAARDSCGIEILDPTPYLCDASKCYGSRNGRPLYYDDDHLSEFGNKVLVPMFAQVFKKA